MSTAKLPLKNSYIFGLVMSDEDICREVIERIFPERKIEGIRLNDQIITEATFHNSVKARGVRLDVLFKDESEWYDIEMQVDDEDSLPLRMRYYSSSMDMDQLSKGEGYENLKANYVIFICCFDMFGKSEPIYCFEMQDENGLKLGDKSFRIILNTKCDANRVPEGLRPLFERINSGTTEIQDEFIQRIDAMIDDLSKDEEVKRNMTIYEDAERHKKRFELEMAKKEEKLIEMNQLLAEKEGQLAEQDEKLAEQDEKLAEQEGQLAKKDGQLAEKDGQLAEQSEQLAEQSEQLAEQSELIRKLQEQLAKYQ